VSENPNAESRTVDLGARQRVLRFLMNNGPVQDPSGRASSRLRAAIEYESGPAGFAQLLAAMDAAGEIDREVRGRRTYRVSLPGVAARSAGSEALGASPDEELLFGRQQDWKSEQPGQSDSLALSLLRMAARLSLAENSWHVAAADPVGAEGRQILLLAEKIDAIERELRLARAECETLARENAELSRVLGGTDSPGQADRRPSAVSRPSENELLARLLQAAQQERETG
jgi:hypothetical protein